MSGLLCKVFGTIQITSVRGAFDCIPARMRGDLSCVRAKPVTSDLPCRFSHSLRVHDNGLLVREVLQHRFQTRLFAQTRILDSAIAEIRRDDER